MKVNEAYYLTCALGAAKSLEEISPDNWIFYSHLRMALASVNRIRPQESYVTIAHYPPKIILNLREAFPIINGTEFRADGVSAITLEANGSGKIKVSAPGILRDITLEWIGSPAVWSGISASVQEMFGIEKADITVTFIDGDGYRCRGLAFYGAGVGNDIPQNKDMIAYDLPQLCEDFESFAAMPVRQGDEYIPETGYRAENNTILLPWNAEEGSYDIWYRRSLRVPEYTDSPADDTTELDLRPGTEDLLPLILAYFTWQYSEPDVAEIFFRDYQNNMQMYLRQNQIPRSTRVIDTNGWLS